MKGKKGFKRKSSINKNESVDTTFRNDWLSRTIVIGDEYFSIDI